MINSLAIEPIKIEKKPNKFVEFLNKFVYSYYYLGLLVVLSFISFSVKIPEILFVPALILFGLIFLFIDDITPVVLGFFIIPSSLPIGTTPDNMMYLAYYLPIALIPMIIHLFKYKPNKTWGKFALSQLLVSIVLILGGIGSNITASQYAKGLTQALTLGLLTLVIYLYIINYSKPNTKDYGMFVAKGMTAVGLSLVLDQFLVMFGNPEIPFVDITHGMVHTGAYLSTNMSMLYLITAPFAFYIGTRVTKTNIIHYFFGLLQFAACFFTYSRGGIVMLLVVVPACIIYSIVKANNKKTTWLCYGILFIIMLAVYLSYLDDFIIIVDRLLDTAHRGSLDDVSSGRISLYKEGFKVFCMFPLFGAGLGYTSPNQVGSLIEFFHFHSTLVQVLACMGIFGFVAYLYNYIVKYKIIFTGIKTHPFNAFVLFAFLGFEGYSMIDCGMFIPMPFVFLITVLVGIIELNNANVKQQEELEKQNEVINEKVEEIQTNKAK